MGAAQEILDILSRQPSTSFSGLRQIKTSAAPAVDCREIHFAYDDHKDTVLKDINMHLAPGEHVALVGESGAGKTTLLNLLLGVYTA